MFPLVLLLVTRKKRSIPPISRTSIQVFVESNIVFIQSPLLQTKHQQFPQPLQDWSSPTQLSVHPSAGACTHRGGFTCKEQGKGGNSRLWGFSRKVFRPICTANLWVNCFSSIRQTMATALCSLPLACTYEFSVKYYFYFFYGLLSSNVNMD